MKFKKTILITLLFICFTGTIIPNSPTHQDQNICSTYGIGPIDEDWIR